VRLLAPALVFGKKTRGQLAFSFYASLYFTAELFFH
jgi:hypothetical protein